MLPRPQIRAFTLVEILVVIAIIAILAAIAFPAYNSFIARGAAAGCISNLRNLGGAMTSYIADSGGRLPGPCFTGINPSIKNNSSMQLAYELRNYLGVPPLTSAVYAVKAVQCPGVTRALLPAGATSAAEINSYIIYSDTDMPSGKKLLNTASATDSGGTTWNSGPFGRTAGLKMPGWPLATLSSKINTNVVDEHGNPPTLSTIPAVYEPNNDLEFRGGKKWPWGVPEKCPHGKNMNVLFFDWHVGQVPANAYSEKGTVWKKR